MATEAEAPESPRRAKTGQPTVGLTKRVRTTLSAATNPDLPAHERHVAQTKVVLASAGGLGLGLGAVEGITQLVQSPLVGPALGAALASPVGVGAEIGFGVPAVVVNAAMALGIGLRSQDEKREIHRGAARIANAAGVAGAATGLTAIGADVLGSVAHVAPGFMHGSAVGVGTTAAVLVGAAAGSKVVGAVWGTKPKAARAL